MAAYFDTKNPPQATLEAFLKNPYTLSAKPRRLNVIYWTTQDENGKRLGFHRKRLTGFDYQFKHEISE